jgi:hypothetical protein
MWRRLLDGAHIIDAVATPGGIVEVFEFDAAIDWLIAPHK